MLVIKQYDRGRAAAYAEKWALSRNPLFYDYSGIGGNCTNFVSQCVYAGSCVMNPTPIFGWYYYSDTERTASWTGVDFFYRFLVENQGSGPFAKEVAEEELMLGDVIQLGREDVGYYHTLLVTGFQAGTYLVSAQTDDARNRPLDTYRYDYARYLHILGVRLLVPDFEDCFEALYNGTEIIINAENASAENANNVENPKKPEQ